MLKQIKVIILLIMISFFGNKVSANYEKLAYEFEFKDLDGSPLDLSEYKGKIIIAINVASQCGFTNQYEDMQNIWEKYQSKGIIVLGIPSNDFGKQEPGNSNEIKNFVKSCCNFIIAICRYHGKSSRSNSNSSIELVKPDCYG